MPAEPFDRARAEALAAELARRSITLVRDEVGLLPLSPQTRLLSVMVTPTDLTPADTSSYEEPRLASSLRQHFNSVDEMVVDHQPSVGDRQRCMDAAADADVVVVGTISANDNQAALVRQLTETYPTVVAALRTPGDLGLFPSVDTYLCTYGVLGPSLDALAAALTSQPIGGHLPTGIANLYPAGHGLIR